MVEVLFILATVTKEIKQGRASESWQYTSFLSTHGYLEKYLKKLLGGADVEDALSRLDRLTQTLTRTAGAEHRKLTRTMDSDVLVLNGKLGVDDKGRAKLRQTGNVQGIVDYVKSVNDRDRAPFIADGAQFVFR